MDFIASHSYRAVTPDLRGAGGTTSAPIDDPTKFTTLHLVGDIIELLKIIAPDEDKVLLVGHAWGAVIAWALCLYRPDKVKALFNMSVCFSPRNPKRKPIETVRAVYGQDHYICRFQEPGEMEDEFAKIGTKRVVEFFLSYSNPDPIYLPKDKSFEDSTDTPITLPSWLSEEVAAFYVNQNWELTAPWTGAQVKAPVKFIIGDMDLTYRAPGAKDYIHKGGLKKDVPFLEEVVVAKGAGHYVHEEKPDEINKYIHEFIQKFSFPKCSAL